MAIHKAKEEKKPKEERKPRAKKEPKVKDSGIGVTVNRQSSAVDVVNSVAIEEDPAPADSPAATDVATEKSEANSAQ